MKNLSFWRLLIILLGVVIIAACSTQSETPTPALKPVSLQLQWVTQAQFAGYYVALDKGWYLEEGIDLTISPGGPDSLSTSLVVLGTQDFGTALTADLSIAIQQGDPLVSIGQIQQKNGLVLVALKSSGIDKPQDFVEKRIGVWLGSWEAQFNALMAKEGISPQDFELRSQGWSMDPFLNGELDVASAMIYNEYHVVLESGIKAEELNIIDYADYDLDFPGDVLMTTREMVEQEPELCLGMLRASLRGWQYAIEHPHETVEIVLKYDKSGVQTSEHQLSMMDEISRLVNVPGNPLGHTDQAAIQRTLDALLRYGILSGPMQPDEVYTNEFWEQIHKEVQ